MPVKKHSLTPDRYHRWKRRFDVNGLDGLRNHNSTPASRPHKLLEEEMVK
ncbi:hypothetical protein [Fuchsiella alkaliacetigena]|nr:hypothetical protein [Fuchsiella alkaliacetigena]MCK8826055.1 hypothetical protein [Fuchsiella alkaliacetigena]